MPYGRCHGTGPPVDVAEADYDMMGGGFTKCVGIEAVALADQDFGRKMVLLAAVTRNMLPMARQWVSDDICRNGPDAVTKAFNQLLPDEMISCWRIPASISRSGCREDGCTPHRVLTLWALMRKDLFLALVGLPDFGHRQYRHESLPRFAIPCCLGTPMGALIVPRHRQSCRGVLPDRCATAEGASSSVAVLAAPPVVNALLARGSPVPLCSCRERNPRQCHLSAGGGSRLSH